MDKKYITFYKKFILQTKTLNDRRIDLNDIVLKKEKEKKQKWFDNEEGLTRRQIILSIVFIFILMACFSAYDYYMYCDVWFYFKEPWC